LHAPGEKTNWAWWSFCLHSHFCSLEILYLLDPAKHSKVPDTNHAKDEDQMHTALSLCCGEDNFWSIAHLKDQQVAMWQALQVAHEDLWTRNHSFWLSHLMFNKPVDSDIGAHLDNELETLFQLKGLITKNKPLNLDEICVAVILNLLPQDWAAMVAL
ncbi:hypothetical protein CROQUDRAFT_18430, partial [Cronartium quercuum f. sp. fusiforme G11]